MDRFGKTETGREVGLFASRKQQPTLSGLMNIVATLNIGKAHITVGAHANEQTVGIEAGILSRFTKLH